MPGVGGRWLWGLNLGLPWLCFGFSNFPNLKCGLCTVTIIVGNGKSMAGLVSKRGVKEGGLFRSAFS